MSKVDDTRAVLREFLTDMAALKGFIDSTNAEAAPFNEAFSVARQQALAAAKLYVAAVKSG